VKYLTLSRSVPPRARDESVTAVTDSLSLAR